MRIPKMPTIGSLLLATAVALAAAVPRFSIPLETEELDGSTETQTVDAAAVPAGGTTLVGEVCNKLGRPITDLTISVTGDKNTPATENAPEKKAPTSTGSSKVSRPGPNGDSSSQSNSERASDDGFTATVQFAGGNGLGPIKPDDCVDVEVSIDSAGTAGDIKVKFSPSTSDKPRNSACEADIMQSMHLDTDLTGQIVALEDPGHDRSSIYLENDEDPKYGAGFITSIDGSCSLPAGVTLQAVYLQDPSTSFCVPNGTNVALDGNVFQISDFAPLGPGETYEVIVVLSSRPNTSYKVMIDTTFVEEE